MLLACVASLVLMGAQPSQYVTPGQLFVQPTGEQETFQVCPLKGTEVSADIARHTTVKLEFVTEIRPVEE